MLSEGYEWDGGNGCWSDGENGKIKQIGVKAGGSRERQRYIYIYTYISIDR